MYVSPATPFLFAAQVHLTKKCPQYDIVVAQSPEPHHTKFVNEVTAILLHTSVHVDVAANVRNALITRFDGTEDEPCELKNSGGDILTKLRDATVPFGTMTGDLAAIRANCDAASLHVSVHDMI